nr:amino acid permease [Streptomyces gossypiisoli]
MRRAIGPGLLILFVIGDILGTGIYATTGQVAGKVGGALWLPFVIGFFVAILTAASYVELVGKYPKAAGAALYTQKAFLVLRRDRVEHHHFRTPTALPVLGAVTALILAGPLSDRSADVYIRAGVLLALGIGLWALNKMVMKVRGEA